MPNKTVLLFMPCLLVPLLSACATPAGAGEAASVAGGRQTEQFCGRSTGGACASDDDCVRAGCSKQVCQSAAEARKVTTCEFRECYDPARYSLSCKCVDGGCGWGQR